MRRRKLEQDGVLIHSAWSNLPEILSPPLFCCYTSTLQWVNEEQSLVTGTNQSQLWKQTFSWPLISLPHLLLLCLSSTSSIPLLSSSPISLPAIDSAFYVVPLLSVVTFMPHIHLSFTLFLREHWWRIYAADSKSKGGLEDHMAHWEQKRNRGK